MRNGISAIPFGDRFEQFMLAVGPQREEMLRYFRTKIERKVDGFVGKRIPLFVRR